MRCSSLALVAVALLLVGCAAQQRQAMVRQTTSCVVAAYNSPEGAPLHARTPLNANDVSLAQLADTSVASAAETAAIAVTWPRIQACQKQFLAKLDKLAPPFAPLFEQAYRDNDNDAVALIQHAMTWGEFNKRRRDRAIANREKLQAEEQQIAAQDQARAYAIIQGLATAYAISAAAPPVHSRASFMSCTQQGAFTNCVQQ